MGDSEKLRGACGIAEQPRLDSTNCDAEAELRVAIWKPRFDQNRWTLKLLIEVDEYDEWRLSRCLVVAIYPSADILLPSFDVNTSELETGLCEERPHYGSIQISLYHR